MLKMGAVRSDPCRVDNGINDCAMADRMQEFVEVFHAQLRSRSWREIICVDGKAEWAQFWRTGEILISCRLTRSTQA